MKKRSMMAIASLATGFVVAAISPPHGGEHQVLGDHRSRSGLGVDDTPGTAAQAVGDGALPGELPGADQALD